MFQSKIEMYIQTKNASVPNPLWCKHFDRYSAIRTYQDIRYNIFRSLQLQVAVNVLCSRLSKTLVILGYLYYIVKFTKLNYTTGFM